METGRRQREADGIEDRAGEGWGFGSTCRRGSAAKPDSVEANHGAEAGMRRAAASIAAQRPWVARGFRPAGAPPYKEALHLIVE